MVRIHVLSRATLLAAALVLATPAGAMVTASCTAAPAVTFMPSWGETYVSQDIYSRYVEQTFYWHDDARVDWFYWTPDSTFELETIFYNYDGYAYGLEPSGYWDSNLPWPYVDTQLSDSSDEKAVTIGTASATDLRAGTYYYITRFRSGGGTQSLVKVTAQRGRRIPSGCMSTYCAFACDSAENGLNPVPFQSYFYAPGCRQWWWSWNATVNLACRFP